MKRFAAITGYIVGVMMLVSLVAPGQTAAAVACPNQSILGFPAWFNGLDCTGDVTAGYTVMPKTVNDTWIIVMNVVQWLILAGGYISLYFIIWSGFKFIIAEGDPEKIKTARQTITNSVIGLVIVLVAVAVVRTIQVAVVTGAAK
jgi:Type IV secretion system pilin